MAEKFEFIDLQVNGFMGVDFNSDNLDAEKLNLACTKLKEKNTTRILATVITDDIPAMCGRLGKMVELRENDSVVADVIAGFHIEGPFINQTRGYRGAHKKEAVKPACPEGMKQLLEAAGGLTRVVTLAPENDEGFKVTRMLSDMGISVSAGHCDPSLDELRGAVDAGVKLITHLGNGCPMLINRHDNIIQRALSLSDHLTIGFIADGAHIPFFSLANYLKVTGFDNALIVTDAICAAGLGPGEYELGYWKVKVGDDMVARSPDGSHLVGAAITMPETYKNLINMGISEADIKKLLCDNPAKFI